jgi:hypothetical protein
MGTFWCAWPDETRTQRSYLCVTTVSDCPLAVTSARAEDWECGRGTFKTIGGCHQPSWGCGPASTCDRIKISFAAVHESGVDAVARLSRASMPALWPLSGSGFNRSMQHGSSELGPQRAGPGLFLLELGGAACAQPQSWRPKTPLGDSWINGSTTLTTLGASAVRYTNGNSRALRIIA